MERVATEWEMGPFWGGAECTHAMFSVIATVCASLVLLETASSAF